ncbi:hypothetical protein RJT34_29176 [Clitoria ternatea]|uniref:F-box domain-containing protein n=1 Tax=Clitoria ternatea TaxID=43366 RepID=A0AAN9FBS9_CLITE
MANNNVVLCYFCSFSLLLSQMAKGCRSKCQKLGLIKREPDGVDRISNLPDDVICHILSFLSTKEVVATSVLSTRWRSLWTLVPTLDFEDDWRCFLRTSFVNVVGNVLAQRKAKSIKRLNLSSYIKSYGPDLIHTLVSTAVAQNLAELNLFLFYPFQAGLPSTLFTCRTITVLKLGWTINVNLTSSIYLPSLKILHLYLLYFANDDSLVRLLSGCPVLEELCYEDMKLNNTTSLKVYVPSLKKLHVKSHDKILHVDAPSLEYLQLEDTKIGSYFVGNFPMLQQAHVDIYFDQDGKENVSKFFNGIHQSKLLSLSTYTTEVLTFAGFEFPEFSSLVHLKLHLSILDSNFLIQLLLTKCPNLEVLDIAKIQDCSERRWTQPTTLVPDCLFSSLTVFKFREFKCSEEELEFIGYILENGRVLRTLMIQMVHWLRPKKISRAVSKLRALPRASKDCLINYQILDRRLT